MSTATIQSSIPSTDTQVITQSSASPAVVDLSKLTPQAVEGGTPVEMPAPGVPEPTVQLEQRLKLDLAAQLGIDISQIETVKVEPTTWPDTSLDCPQPDTIYNQSLVEGYQVTLKANGATFDYHTAGTEQFILCNPKQ